MENRRAQMVDAAIARDAPPIDATAPGRRILAARDEIDQIGLKPLGIGVKERRQALSAEVSDLRGEQAGMRIRRHRRSNSRLVKEAALLGRFDPRYGARRWNEAFLALVMLQNLPRRQA